MELLESDSPGRQTPDTRKGESATLADSETGRILKNALIVGGVLAGSWLVLQLIQQASKRKQQKTAGAEDSTVSEQATVLVSPESSLLSAIGDRVAREATVFLLNLAREKIATWLESKKSADERH